MKRYSTSYVFTANVNCADDMLRVELLRKSLKIINADLRPDDDHGVPPKRFRLSLRARLGKNGPFNYLYKPGMPLHTGMVQGSIYARHADHFDVYIYSYRRY